MTTPCRQKRWRGCARGVLREACIRVGNANLWCMRLNIEIDGGLMRRAMHASGQRTKRATVEAALQAMVRLEEQEIVLDSFGRIPDLEFVRERLARSARRSR